MDPTSYVGLLIRLYDLYVKVKDRAEFPKPFGRSKTKDVQTQIDTFVEGKAGPVFYSFAYPLALTHLVYHGSEESQALYISVGEADFAFAWLTRLFQEAAGRANRDERPYWPNISQVILITPSVATIRRMEEHAELGAKSNERMVGFRNRMYWNVRGIKEIVGGLRPQVDVQHWQWIDDPQFHGYVRGRWAYVGAWAIPPDSTNPHVRTALVRVSDFEIGMKTEGFTRKEPWSEGDVAWILGQTTGPSETTR